MTDHPVELNIATASLSDEVYRALCADIADGIFQPGDKLGIEKIARLKGVSPMPVREALQRMGRDGLVAAHLNCGFRVKKITPEEVREIWAIRIELETLAIRWLMQKSIGKKLIRTLRDNCEEYQANDMIQKLYRLDMAFHGAIIQHCGSQQLQDILGSRLILLNSFFLTNAIVMVPQLGAIERSYQEHVDIVNRIEQGDTSGAESALRKHLELASRLLLRSFESQRPQR